MEPTESLGRQAFGCALSVSGLLILMVVVSCFCLSAGTILLLGSVMDYLPNLYNEKMAEFFDVDVLNKPRLNEEDVEKVEELGLDPEFAAVAVLATQWIEEVYETFIDLGIVLSIHFHESGSGRSMGTCDGEQAATSNPNLNPSLERKAIHTLLKIWEENRIRDKNPLAAKFIYPDYSGYVGHCSAGEMGAGGFIPTTGLKVCNGLQDSEDPEVASCDFWSNKVTAHSIVYWLHLIGYRGDQDDQTKWTELYGWNHLGSYRWKLIDKAKEINDFLGDLSIDGYNDVYINPDDELGLIKGWIAALLVIFDLLPDDFGNAISPGSQLWLDSPLPPKSVRGVGVSQRWKGLEHQGVDFVCHQGSSVVAVADGVRVKPSSPWYTYDGNGWGYALWLDHGGVYSFYGHLSAFSIDFDEKVKKGQEIGKCGNTGNSTGPHVHFAVSVKHPDKFVKWNDTGAWRDPDLYLGKEVNPKNKE